MQITYITTYNEIPDMYYHLEEEYNNSDIEGKHITYEYSQTLLFNGEEQVDGETHSDNDQVSDCGLLQRHTIFMNDVTIPYTSGFFLILRIIEGITKLHVIHFTA